MPLDSAKSAALPARRDVLSVGLACVSGSTPPAVSPRETSSPSGAWEVRTESPLNNPRIEPSTCTPTEYSIWIGSINAPARFLPQVRRHPGQTTVSPPHRPVQRFHCILGMLDDFIQAEGELSAVAEDPACRSSSAAGPSWTPSTATPKPDAEVRAVREVARDAGTSGTSSTPRDNN